MLMESRADEIQALRMQMTLWIGGAPTSAFCMGVELAIENEHLKSRMLSNLETCDDDSIINLASTMACGSTLG